MPLDCDNIFEGDLDFDLDDYSEITKVCPEIIRTLMQRDEWLLEVMKKLNDEMLKICARSNELEEVAVVLEDVINSCCYTYPPYDLLADFMI